MPCTKIMTSIHFYNSAVVYSVMCVIVKLCECVQWEPRNIRHSPYTSGCLWSSPSPFDGHSRLDLGFGGSYCLGSWGHLLVPLGETNTHAWGGHTTPRSAVLLTAQCMTQDKKKPLENSLFKRKKCSCIKLTLTVVISCSCSLFLCSYFAVSLILFLY